MRFPTKGSPTMTRISLPHSGVLCLAALLFLFPCGCANDEFDRIGNIDPDVPFPVTDLAATFGDGIARLTWTATGDDGPNGRATRYDLRRHDEPITDANWAMADGVPGLIAPAVAGSTEIQDVPFDASSQAVYLALRVVDDAGNVSGLSNVIFLDRQPPAVITDLSVRITGHQSLVLTWTAPSDDGPGGTAERYELRASTGELNDEVWADIRPAENPAAGADAGAAESIPLRGLEPTTTYKVAVRARDVSGNLSAMSNIVEVTTTAEPRGWWDGFVGNSPANMVHALHARADTLYVGGRFAAVGAIAAGAVAAWDGVGWSPMGAGVSGGQFGTAVYDFADYQGALYVVGSFGQAGGSAAANNARWTGAGWESTGDGPSDFPAIALAVWGDDLYFGGPFNQPTGSPFTALSRFDGTAFHATGWSGSNTGYPQDLHVWNGELVIGGIFDLAPGTSANSLAFYDGTSYTVPEPPLTGRLELPIVSALATFQGDLIVGGDFPFAGGTRLNSIARWDGAAWHPLGSGLADDEFPVVNDLLVYRGYLIAAGRFDTAGGLPANNIAAWDGFQWQPLGAGLEASGFVSAHCLAEFQGSLFVGGQFDRAGGLDSRFIARWDQD